MRACVAIYTFTINSHIDGGSRLSEQQPQQQQPCRLVCTAPHPFIHLSFVNRYTCFAYSQTGHCREYILVRRYGLLRLMAHAIVLCSHRSIFWCKIALQSSASSRCHDHTVTLAVKVIKSYASQHNCSKLSLRPLSQLIMHGLQGVPPHFPPAGTLQALLPRVRLLPCSLNGQLDFVSFRC